MYIKRKQGHAKHSDRTTGHARLRKLKKMKTETVFVNRNAASHLPVVVSILSGRYGTYSKVRGINRSEKAMMEMGYRTERLTDDEMFALAAAHKSEKDAQDKIYHDEKMKERFDCVAECLACEPVSVIENEGGNPYVSMIANLSDTNMIDQYGGCGKGTAYVTDNKVVAFHYGYEQPANAPDNTTAVRIEFSCTQICF